MAQIDQQDIDEVVAYEAERKRRQGVSAPGASAGGGGSVSPELQATLDANGISIPTGGQYTTEEDPPVFWGTTDSKGRTRRVAPYIARSEALVAPARWRTEDLRAFQKRMFDAGMFGSAQEWEVVTGIFDPLTQQQWRSLVDTAAIYAKAGKKLRPQDILDQFPAVGGGPKGEENLPPNPYDLEASARQAGPSLLGRKFTDAEKSSFTSGLSALMMNESADAPGQAGQEEWARQKARELDSVAYDSNKVVQGLRGVFEAFGGGE